MQIYSSEIKIQYITFPLEVKLILNSIFDKFQYLSLFQVNFSPLFLKSCLLQLYFGIEKMH